MHIYRKWYNYKMGKIVQSKSFKYLPSPLSSHVISPRCTSQNQEIAQEQTIYNKLVNFLSTQHISLLRKKLLQFRGTHNPISYKQNFKFQQRWQKTFKSTQQQTSFNSLMPSNKFLYIFSFLVMIVNFMLVWFLSVFRLYQIEHSQYFFQIGLCFIITDIILKFSIYLDYYQNNNQIIKIQKLLLNYQFLISLFSDVWCFIYYVCILSESQLYNVHNNSMLSFDFITIAILTKRGYEIYNSLVIFIIATKYKNQMTIFDLVIKMLLILHFFSIILYGVAMTSPESNWMTRLTMEDNLWGTKYIYTLYFACTTMFTVGYGDILPTNKAEIITIMFIQALGMALFGYIVNEVGAALGNMRKKRANLQRDIYNAQRISNQYDLVPQLGKKVRDYVISNQIAQQQLAINEQNDFLLKLNQDLRNQVKQSHQLKIIKTSLFFISHWSKKIQIEMAKKLQKCIFAPNQNIHSRSQVDRLFIMVKGKIQVYTQRTNGTKVCCRKLLKTIQKLPGQQVFRNVYGFTSFFSGKCNRLKAIAKQSTICYTLGYENMKDSINEDSNDFQYFHQLRQIFNFSKVPQKWQTPNIVNIRQNYSPIHTKLSQTQNRQKSYNRRDYTNKLIHEANHIKSNPSNVSFYGQSYEEDTISSSERQTQIVIKQQQVQFRVSDYLVQSDDVNQSHSNQSQIKSMNSFKHSPLRKQITNEIQNACLYMIQNSGQFVSNRNYRRKYLFNQNQERYQQKARAFTQENIILTSQFQMGKNYNRFFPKFNKRKIIERLIKKPQLIKQDYLINTKRFLKSTTLTNNSHKLLKRKFTQIFKNQVVQDY